MKTSFLCGVLRAQRVMTMWPVLLLLFLHAHEVIAAPRIEWSPSSIEVAVPQGQSTTVAASFVASEDLNREVTVRLVPELAPFVTVVAPATFAGLTAGETRTIEITFAPSSDAPIGTFDATLQLRDGRRVLARPLPITLTIEEAPRGFPITVVGQVLFDDGRPVSGATVSGSIAEGALTPVLQQASRQFLEATDYTQPEFKRRGHSRPTEAFLLVESAADPETTTDDTGAFTLELMADSLPADVIVEVNFHADSLPAVDTAKRATAEDELLDIGTIVIPDPTASEMTLANGTAESGDGTILVDGLPPEVDRLFARSFDPDEDPEAFPGEFAEMGQIPLNSSVFLWMEALDANGNPVTDLSQAATIRAMVPQSQWGDLEDISFGTDRIEVPIYFYDEAANLWQQQGVGWLEDDVGTVLPEDAQSLILDGTFPRDIFATFTTDHLSWMNVDYPFIGPWTLSRIDSSRRNDNCLFQALQLAKTIAKSAAGRVSYAKFNVPGGDLDVELADAAGPELKSDNLNGAYGEFKGNENGDRDDQLYLDNSLWDGCRDGATTDQKNNTTLIMAVTLLHESAHWKWDVKHENGNWQNAEPGGEAGNELERDLFGGIMTNGAGIKRDGAPVDNATRDAWLDPSNWPPPGGLNSRSTAAQLAQQQSEPSPLELTISLPEDQFELGEEIPVEVEYQNASDAPIRVLTPQVLEGYPLWFEIIPAGGMERVPFLGTRGKRIIDFDQDFVTLDPGEVFRTTVNLLRDPETGERRYNLISSGAYAVTAFYSGHWGLPETQSNTVVFTVGAGGSISGDVTDATNGQAIGGATLKALQEGVAVAVVTTADDGSYNIPELPPGAFTLEASAPGFLRSTRDVTVVAGSNTVANFSLSPLLTAGEIRLVLTWGQDPRDLDSHLWLPMEVPYHVAYFRRGNLDECPFAVLDTDVTSGFGPETITISQRFLEGTYSYAVFNFSGSPALAGSGAQVQVFDSSGQIATIDVPTEGAGRWWNVLTIDGETGAIMEVNQLVDNAEPYPDTDAGCATP